MPLRNSTVLRWSPASICDAEVGDDAFPGAMALLQNLVPSNSTKNVWVPRPAAQTLTTFPSFSSPGFISCLFVVGNFAYGMISSNRNIGYDEPFCFDLVNHVFVTITGIASGNVPHSLNTFGNWSPPHMDLIGVKVTLAHLGFVGTSCKVGWIDISNPEAPVWSAGDTATTPLPAVPTWVSQYNQRAFYLVNPLGGQPAAIATDVLDPTKITNPTYILTFGDNVAITCSAGLPLNNALGGVFQSLIIFKGAYNMFQITGDFASTSNPIAQNSLNIATGTEAPNSITSTPLGLSFVSPEGLRIINFSAVVSDPIGEPSSTQQAGIVVPLINSLYPSRIASACNAKVIRISVPNSSVYAEQASLEYWYDIPRKLWSGPHTFSSSLLQPYIDTFIATLAPTLGGAALWDVALWDISYWYNQISALYQSDSTPSLLTEYLENQGPMTFNYTTTFLPERGDAHQCVMNETYLYASLGSGQGMSVQVTDQFDNVLASYAISAAGPPTLWDVALWDVSVWDGPGTPMEVHALLWTSPIEFDRIQFTVTGTSVPGVELGDTYLRYQPLGYSARP